MGADADGERFASFRIARTREKTWIDMRRAVSIREKPGNIVEICLSGGSVFTVEGRAFSVVKKLSGG